MKLRNEIWKDIPEYSKNTISKELKKTRESSLVITKLDEALMWLDRYYTENFGGEE